MTGTVDGIDLGMLDPADADERRLLIEADHPLLQQALQEGLDEIVLDGHVMKPGLHIALHEIVAERLCADDPPDTWSTAQRLSELGYDRHEVLHMLMSVVSDELFHAMQPDAAPQDSDRTRGALAALPESWEVQRETPSPNRAERRAKQRTHRRRPR